MFFQGILYFCYWFVSSHWNPVSVSYWKCIVVFVMILSVPINQEHWASAVCFRIFVSKKQLQSHTIHLIVLLKGDFTLGYLKSKTLKYSYKFKHNNR